VTFRFFDQSFRRGLKILFSSLPNNRSPFFCRFSTFPGPFDFISWDHVILDELHSLLRVTDKLLELLIEELQQIGTSEKLTDAFSSLGIQFHYYLDKQGTLSWTSLSGVGKRKMLCGPAYPSLLCFPKIPRAAYEFKPSGAHFTSFMKFTLLSTIVFKARPILPPSTPKRRRLGPLNSLHLLPLTPINPTTDVEYILIHPLPHTFMALSFIYHK